MAYWYNVSTGQVEQDGQTEPKGELMGPYETREEAESALELARRRTEAWDEEDRAWEEGGSAEGTTDNG
nr:methionine aminopeptidase [Barrientosiimonas endolithica]